MWHAWGRGEVFTGFCLGSPKVRVANWIRLTEYRDQWRASLSTVMKLRVP
jgi:hypothetical protein